MAEILLIEDDLRLRTELEKHLEKGGHGVCGTADGKEGLETLTQIAFDVVILDVRLPGMSGTEVLKEVAEHFPCHPPLIIITGHGDKETAIKAVHFGAFDFLEKPFTPQALDHSISRALTEKREDALKYKAHLATTKAGSLTARESEVATLAAEGWSNEEIGQRLSMGSETVKSHLKKIFRKLGVPNRTALSSRLRK
jgi:DNA-binding NarL/FixJ family response regulator